MLQRGRKSGDALALVTVLPGARAEPPAELTPEQAEEWRAVVATKPAEWFNRDSQALLVDYCRHVIIARTIAARIDRFTSDDLDADQALERYDRLTRMLERHTRAVTTLATKMRLTQQSRYDAKSSNTASRRAGGPSKPWEAGAGDADARRA